MSDILKAEMAAVLHADLLKRERELRDEEIRLKKLLKNVSRRVVSALCCLTGAAGLAYGVLNFQFQRVSSVLVAITIALSLTLGAALVAFGAWSYLRIFFHSPKKTLSNVEDELRRVRERLQSD